jgi:hypothetical protein
MMVGKREDFMMCKRMMVGKSEDFMMCKRMMVGKSEDFMMCKRMMVGKREGAKSRAPHRCNPGIRYVVFIRGLLPEPYSREPPHRVDWGQQCLVERERVIIACGGG